MLYEVITIQPCLNSEGNCFNHHGDGRKFCYGSTVTRNRAETQKNQRIAALIVTYISSGDISKGDQTMADFGETDAALTGATIPVRAILGDQQAATVV